MKANLSFGDRLNPIFARELIQSTRSRVFLVITLTSLLVILVAAMLLAKFYRGGDIDGLDAFRLSISLLAGLLLFIVPFMAFASMKQEVGAGAAESLTLSRMGPARIIWGRLQSNLIQTFLYLGLFSPLVTLSFFFRSVTLLDIFGQLVFVSSFSLALTAIALTFGALCKYQRGATVLHVLIGLLLGLVTWIYLMYLNIGFSTADIDHQALILVPAICLFLVALFAQAATAVLKHPFENRSTGLRITVILGPIFFFTIIYLVSGGRNLDDGILAVGIFSCLGMAPFLHLFSTEDRRLSPRVRAYLGVSPLRFFPLSLLLPGGGRGLLFSVFYLTLVMGMTIGIYCSLRSHIYGEVVKGYITFYIWGINFVLGAALFKTMLGPRRIWRARIIWPLLFWGGFFILMMAIASGSRGNPFAALIAIGSIGAVVLSIVNAGLVVSSHREVSAVLGKQKREPEPEMEEDHAG